MLPRSAAFLPIPPQENAHGRRSWENRRGRKKNPPPRPQASPRPLGLYVDVSRPRGSRARRPQNQEERGEEGREKEEKVRHPLHPSITTFFWHILHMLARRSPSPGFAREKRRGGRRRRRKKVYSLGDRPSAVSATRPPVDQLSPASLPECVQFWSEEGGKRGGGKELQLFVLAFPLPSGGRFQ